MTLIDATKSGNLGEVTRLLSEGADVHELNDKAFRVACGRGWKNITKLLVAHGANIHANDDEALRHAHFYKKNELINYLNNLMLLEKLNEIN
jgi:ankyrin repeat protein